MIRSFVGIVLSMILLAACAGQGTVPSSSATSSPPPSPSGSPSVIASPTDTPTASPTPLQGWQQTMFPSVIPGKWAMPVAVAAGDGRLVAVGGPVRDDRDQQDAQTYGTTWTSTDGLAWTASGLDPALEVGSAVPTSGPSPGLLDVAYGPEGFVALGYAGTDSIGVAIWRSEDGLTWERIDLGEGLFDGARPAAVRAGGPGYLVVGAVLGRDAPSRSAAPPRAAVWTSPDGRTWARVPDQASFGVGGYIDTGEEPATGGMLDVTSTGTGLVAVGQTCRTVDFGEPFDALGSCRPLVWTSGDALSWKGADPKVAVHPGWLPAIAAVDGRIVAVGGGWDQSAARYVLRSADGSTWRWTEEPGLAAFEGIVALPGGLMASSYEAEQVTLWTSADGTAWRAVSDLPTMPGSAMLRESDLVAMDDRVVVVGWRENHDDPDATGFALVGPIGR